MQIERRSFLSGLLATFPLAVIGQASPALQGKANRVAAGEDRYGEHHRVGISTTDIKVAGKDASGGLFVMEHTNQKKGGPPRHLHHQEDEWFYVLAGEYIFEVGTERFRLNAGDSLLGPRNVPHVWAFVSDTPGKLLISFAPANKMEEFFGFTQGGGRAYSDWKDPKAQEHFRAYGMELLGPPLSLE